MTLPMGAFTDWVLYPSVRSCCSICWASWSRSLFFPWKLRLSHAAVSLGIVVVVFAGIISYRQISRADAVKGDVFFARYCTLSLSCNPVGQLTAQRSSACESTQRHQTSSLAPKVY